MNTHDIELPPLPEWVDWPVTVSEMSASEIKEAMQAYARTAIEADRKTTERQLAAYKRLVNSLESRLTDIQAQHDELKKSTNPELLASERAANAILTEELEADRKRRGERAGWNPVDGNAHGYEGDIVLRHKNGEYRIGHSNWIESHLVQPYPPTKPKEAAYVGTLRMGYTSWMALDLPAPQPAEPPQCTWANVHPDCAARKHVEPVNVPLDKAGAVGRAFSLVRRLKDGEPVEDEIRQVIRQIAAEPVKALAPEKCPITNRPFFMWIEHHETGEMVPTYGGPYDSYTLPERDADGFVCERYDHDEGRWVTECVESVGLKLVGDQSFVVDVENPRYEEIEAFASAESVSTHHVHRGVESLPCYCIGKDDHPIGKESLGPVKVPSDAEIISLAREHGSCFARSSRMLQFDFEQPDILNFARALLARYGRTTDEVTKQQREIEESMRRGARLTDHRFKL